MAAGRSARVSRNRGSTRRTLRGQPHIGNWQNREGTRQWGCRITALTEVSNAFADQPDRRAILFHCDVHTLIDLTQYFRKPRPVRDGKQNAALARLNQIDRDMLPVRIGLPTRR